MVVTADDQRDLQDPVFVQKAFGDIADRYVLTNHVLSLGTDVLWRNKVAKIVAGFGPELILDIATGSGDLAAAVAKRCPGARLFGADFCRPMLEHARRRGLENLIVADGTRMPFDDAVFDVVTVAFGLRNMEDWGRAAAEMARVTRPGGCLVVLDFSLPTIPGLRGLYRFYLNRILPKIAGLLTGKREAYEYLAGTIESFPSGEGMCQLLRGSGFADVRSLPLSFGIASVYVAKK